jgi:GT2 family glycosyltransferase
MNSNLPIASVVIITHCRPDDLAKCLESVERQTAGEIEIIVVDNASTDNTLAMLAERFTQVRVYPSKSNLGVSEGRNVGIEMARSEVCICIDDDAVFATDDAVSQAISYFESDPTLAAIAMTILSSSTGTEERKGIPRLDKKVFSQDYDCTYFCGAGFAVRRSMFLEAGRFWAPLVYGSQELDLAYRFLDRSWRLVHSAGIRVIHKSSPLARPSGQWVFFNTRDRSWVAIRHLPWPAVITTTLLWWGQTLWVSLRTGAWGSFFRGLTASLVGMGEAYRTRQVISRQAIKQLRTKSGRYWY